MLSDGQLTANTIVKSKTRVLHNATRRDSNSSHTVNHITEAITTHEIPQEGGSSMNVFRGAEPLYIQLPQDGNEGECLEQEETCASTAPEAGPNLVDHSMNASSMEDSVSEKEEYSKDNAVNEHGGKRAEHMLHSTSADSSP